MKPTALLAAVRLRSRVFIAEAIPTFGLAADRVELVVRLTVAELELAADLATTACLTAKAIFDDAAKKDTSLVLIVCNEARFGDTAANVFAVCLTTSDTFVNAAVRETTTIFRTRPTLGDAADRVGAALRVINAAAELAADLIARACFTAIPAALLVALRVVLASFITSDAFVLAAVRVAETERISTGALEFAVERVICDCFTSVARLGDTPVSEMTRARMN
jgi:hypothetical protein